MLEQEIKRWSILSSLHSTFKGGGAVNRYYTARSALSHGSAGRVRGGISLRELLGNSVEGKYPAHALVEVRAGKERVQLRVDAYVANHPSVQPVSAKDGEKRGSHLHSFSEKSMVNVVLP